MQSVLQDFRYALRQLRRSPGFTVTAVAVLALGIGANVAVFTLLSGVLLRPLPYADPSRIVTVVPFGSRPYYAITMGNVLRLRDAALGRVQVEFIAQRTKASVLGPGGRLQVEHAAVSAGLLPMLGVQPALGRFFRDDENQPGRNGVLVLGDETWRNLYGAAPNILGKSLTILGHPYTIVGVMPKGFSCPFEDRMQVWTPAAITSADRQVVAGDKGDWLENVYARLPENMTAAQLAGLFTRQQAVLSRQNSDYDVPPEIRVTDYRESLNHAARKPLMLLYAVVIGIWVLACLNVTSLMLARALVRSRERAVRAAIGASRGRLLQQTVIESLLLSSIGAVVGMLLGQSAIKLLWRSIQHRLPMTNAVHVDWRVTGCLVALTLTSSVVTGILPALRAMRRDVREDLHAAGSTARASQNQARELLVVAQIALTLVFLVGAGLFLRTVDALRRVPLGFTQQNVLTGGVILNPRTHTIRNAPEALDVNRLYYTPLLEKMRAIPGVEVAALSSVLPLRAEFSVSIMGELDHKKTSREQTPQADGRLASPGLVEAIGIPMVRGRFFTEDDTANAPVVVVVNQAFAHKYLPGQNPIGHSFSLGQDRFREMHIVGVIGDMKQKNVAQATKPELYFCLAQMGPGSPLYGIATAFVQVAIRGAVPAGTLRVQFDKALHEVAPDATTTDVKTVHEAAEDSFGSQTLTAYLLEGFAGVALLIASVGLYGLLSFTVAQRTREIGLRLALGAPISNIRTLVLRRAIGLLVLGLAIGSGLSWFATRLARSYIFGVQPHDALTFAVVLAVLSACSLLAALLPARRAAAVDPILALRSE